MVETPDRATIKAWCALADVNMMPWQLALFPKHTAEGAKK